MEPLSSLESVQAKLLKLAEFIRKNRFTICYSIFVSYCPPLILLFVGHLLFYLLHGETSIISQVWFPIWLVLGTGSLVVTQFCVWRDRRAHKASYELLTLEDDILIYQLAQESKPIEIGLDWFDSLGENDQKAVLSRVSDLILHHGGSASDGLKAVELSGANKKCAAARILKSTCKKSVQDVGKLYVALSEIVLLHKCHGEKSFRLLCGFLGLILDKQRTTKTVSLDCWWLMDLSDERVVNQILETVEY